MLVGVWLSLLTSRLYNLNPKTSPAALLAGLEHLTALPESAVILLSPKAPNVQIVGIICAPNTYVDFLGPKLYTLLGP